MNRTKEKLPKKNCQTCGKEIIRKYYHSKNNWFKVKFCSSGCFKHTEEAIKRIQSNINVISNRYKKGDKPPHTGKTKKEFPNLSRSGVKKGNIPSNFKGGWIENGYRILSIPGKKRIFEHRFIMEQFLKRKLAFNEIVHHINGNKLDNRLENLIILSRKEHPKIHNRWKHL